MVDEFGNDLSKQGGLIPSRNKADSCALFPGEGVEFRLISEGVVWGLVFEASQPCTVIVLDGLMEEGISLVVRQEVVFAAIGTGAGMVSQGFGKTPVETFDHAVGLGVEGLCEAMLDGAVLADAIEGMSS